MRPELHQLPAQCTSGPHRDPDSGHRSNNRTLGKKNPDVLFIVLGLSGGRARAVHARVACKNLGGNARCQDKILNSCLNELQLPDDAQSVMSQIYVIHDSFDLIDAEKRRRRYQSIPTTPQLPGEDIDALINVVPEVINESPEFHTVLQDLNADINYN